MMKELNVAGFMKSVEITEVEGSSIVIAKKRIILPPQKKIILLNSGAKGMCLAGHDNWEV